MGEDEKEESQCRPEPADLHEIQIKHVALLRKITRRFARGIGLGMWEVRRIATCWMEAAEK